MKIPNRSIFLCLSTLLWFIGCANSTIKEGVNPSVVPNAPTQTVEPSTVKFSAMLQFVLGHVKRVPDAFDSRDLVYQDSIFADETLKVPENGYVKLVTRDTCVFVVYGPAFIYSKIDEDGASLWRTNAQSWRGICPPQGSLKVSCRGIVASIGGGAEYYVDKSENVGHWLIARRGPVKINGINLKENVVYNFTNRYGLDWVWPKLDTSRLNEFVGRHPLPKEAIPLPKGE